MIAKPNPAQLNYYKESISCFLHFGMNTFTDVEWGDGKAPLSAFTLENFDYDDYVKSIKSWGFKRLIFTAKHHDGFCMWHTKMTDYHIGNTSYKKDFLEELSKSCTKHDIDMGIYLSPWDVHEKSYGSGQDYNIFYKKQIEEISSNKKYGNNGKFVEWWFDGAKDPKFPDQIYDFFDWMDTVREYNPNILMFGLGSYGGIHWVGNENGYVNDPNYNLLRNNQLTFDEKEIIDISKEDLNPFVWSVPEADTCTTDGWFWHKDEKLKSLHELMDIYFNSVGKGSVLLLNIAANKSGKIPDNLKVRMSEFTEEVKRIKSKKIKELTKRTYSDDKSLSILYNFTTEKYISCIEIKEDILKGQTITNLEISIDGKMFTIVKSVGFSRLIKIEKQVRDLQIKIGSIGQINLIGVEIYG